MNYIRNIFISVLIFFSIYEGAALYHLYLYDFDDILSTSFYANDSISEEKMKEDIFEGASDYGIDVFFIDTYIEGDYSDIIKIYASDNAKDILERDYLIKAGSFDSVFFGRAEVLFYTIDELSLQAMERSPEGYRIFGDYNDALQYKSTLVSTYGGHIPREAQTDKTREIRSKYLILLALQLFMVFLSTYYKVVKMRKEAFIRLFYGTSIKKYLINEFCKDSTVYIGSFALSSLVVYKTEGILFLYKISLLFLTLILGTVFILYFSLLFRGVRFSISNVTFSQKLLDAGMLLKIVLTAATCILLASSFSLISEYFDMRMEKPFYEQRKDKIYITFTDVPVDEADPYLATESVLYTKFYTENFKRLNIEYACGDMQYGDFYDDKIEIRVNGNLRDYMLHTFKEYKDEIKNEKACLFIPKETKLSEEEMKYVLDYNLRGFADLKDKDDVKVIYYKGNAYLSAYVASKGYKLIKHPIVFFRNEFTPSDDFNFDGIANICMTDPDYDVIDAFCNENKCRYIKSNVYDSFMLEYNRIKEGALLSICFLCFVAPVWLMISYSLIRLMFEAHRTELLIMKITGTKVIKRMRELLLLTIAPSLATVIFVAVFYRMNGLSNLAIVIVILLIAVTLEIIFSIICFLRAEQESIHRTIKGGF